MQRGGGHARFDKARRARHEKRAGARNLACLHLGESDDLHPLPGVFDLLHQLALAQAQASYTGHSALVIGNEAGSPLTLSRDHRSCRAFVSICRTAWVSRGLARAGNERAFRRKVAHAPRAPRGQRAVHLVQVLFLLQKSGKLLLHREGAAKPSRLRSRENGHNPRPRRPSSWVRRVTGPRPLSLSLSLSLSPPSPPPPPPPPLSLPPPSLPPSLPLSLVPSHSLSLPLSVSVSVSVSVCLCLSLSLPISLLPPVSTNLVFRGRKPVRPLAWAGC